MSVLSFLSSVFNSSGPETVALTRPKITLTFAQSLDAKIAGKNGKQLILSGPESMVMTHWLRTMHDGILVGIGTAINDDPQLNTRHLPARDPIPGCDHSNPYHLPRPIILDSRLRLPITCKLLMNYRNGQGRRPWIFFSEEGSSSADDMDGRRSSLEAAGAKVFEIKTNDDSGNLSIISALHKLHELGIKSLMVEGGAKVIASFLAERDDGTQGGIVDTIITTVAPMFVGTEGVGYDVIDGQRHQFKHVASHMLGKDIVVALTAV